jgi:hypothetical protein
MMGFCFPWRAIMPTVKLVEETTDHPVVRRVFDDIKATKQIDRVPDIWRALATNPEHLELCWTYYPGRHDTHTRATTALLFGQSAPSSVRNYHAGVIV